MQPQPTASPRSRDPGALAPEKFRDPARTAGGEPRARVALERLDTLWFNTGTLCNLACAHCYIESSPTNDRLAYISAEEVRAYLDEIDVLGWPVREIGFTGGEPFLNPELPAMLESVLSRGYHALVLTNAMRPMMKQADSLLELRERYDSRLVLRVSLDHYSRDPHEAERGARTWRPTMEGLVWLARHGFAVRVAGRTFTGEDDARMRRGFAALFESYGISLEAHDPDMLVLFPEMDESRDVPEITDACWSLLGVRPQDVMCANSRMVVKRKGAERPVVTSCTLLPYDPAFELGERLADAVGPVPLNHPHCARFCVLGGGSCSRAGNHD